MIEAVWLKIRKAVAIAAAFFLLLGSAFLYGRRRGAADEREQNLTDDLKASEKREETRRIENETVKEVERHVDQMDDKRVDTELDKWMRD